MVLERINEDDNEDARGKDEEENDREEVLMKSVKFEQLSWFRNGEEALQPNTPSCGGIKTISWKLEMTIPE